MLAPVLAVPGNTWLNSLQVLDLKRKNRVVHKNWRPLLLLLIWIKEIRENKKRSASGFQGPLWLFEKRLPVLLLQNFCAGFCVSAIELDFGRPPTFLTGSCCLTFTVNQPVKTGRESAQLGFWKNLGITFEQPGSYPQASRKSKKLFMLAPGVAGPGSTWLNSRQTHD